MRIPFFLADLKSGTISHISESLRKMWSTLGQNLTISQAEDLFAELAGYRDLYDAQSHAVASIEESAHKAPSREQIFCLLAWRAMRRRGVDYLDALDIVRQLPIKELAIDCHTAEYQREQWMQNEKENGRWYVMDEYGYYLNHSVDPLTQLYHDAGAPPFSFAVLDEARIFVHSRLSDFVSRLPKNYPELLAQECDGADLDGTDALHAFLRDTVVPHGIVSIDTAIEKHKVMPDSVVQRPVYDGEGNHLGEVLFNTALDGVLPVLYSPDDIAAGRLAGDLKRLLRGVALPYQALPAQVGAKEVFIVPYKLGNVLVENLSGMLSKAGKPHPIRFSKRGAWPHSGGSVTAADGSTVLCGESFASHGNTYLRQQTWVTRESVVRALPQLGQALPLRSSGDESADSAGAVVPADALYWRGLVKEVLDAGSATASARLFCRGGVAEVLELLLRAVSANDLASLCHRIVADHYPLHSEEDDAGESPCWRLEDRLHGTQRLTNLGQDVARVMPELAVFDAVTLGLAYTYAESQYPGARNESWVATLNEGEFAKAFAIVAVLLLIGLPGGWEQHGHLWSSDAESLMAIVVLEILDGKRALANLPSDLGALEDLHLAMRKQDELVKAAESWSAREATRAAQRRDGGYRYTGTAVNPGPRTSISDLFSQARSAGFAPILSHQSVPQLTWLGASPKLQAA